MIALIDYGAGNLTSVRHAFAAIGAGLFVPDSPADLARASAVVVPGVGHFGATRALEGDWTTAILERLGEGRPIFGICLGMQWLFEGSEEAPDCPGLGVLGGRCVRLNAGAGGNGGARHPAGTRIKIPHVGWNSLDLRFDAPIVGGVAANAQVYFTHSYAAPVTGDTVAVTEHGQPFAAIVQRGPVAGVQFHPEKSGDAGLQILRNFMELAS
jgi:glutamine amidotransferase